MFSAPGLSVLPRPWLTVADSSPWIAAVWGHWPRPVLHTGHREESLSAPLPLPLERHRSTRGGAAVLGFRAGKLGPQGRPLVGWSVDLRPVEEELGGSGGRQALVGEGKGTVKVSKEPSRLLT